MTHALRLGHHPSGRHTPVHPRSRWPLVGAFLAIVAIGGAAVVIARDESSPVTVTETPYAMTGALANTDALVQQPAPLVATTADEAVAPATVAAASPPATTVEAPVAAASAPIVSTATATVAETQTPAVATAANTIDITSIDLVAAAPVRQVVAQTGGRVDLAAVQYVDLTGDGRAEAIVPITSDGSYGNLAIVVVTVVDDEPAAVLVRFAGQQRRGLIATLNDGRLAETSGVYGPNDANCCPSQLVKTYFEWDGTALVPGRVETTAIPTGSKAN